MTSDTSAARSGAIDPALDRFLAELGADLLNAGETAQSISATLRRVAHAAGATETDIVVLPTALLVESGGPSNTRLELATADGSVQRFDQMVEVQKIATAATRAELSPSEGLARLRSVKDLPNRYGMFVRVLAGAVQAAGVTLMLQPTAMSLVVASVLGILVAGIQEVRLPELQVVAPAVSAFLCGVIVFALSEVIDSANPIRVLVAPLVMLLPGIMILTSTMELAAGQMVSGATRFVTGIMQVLLLAVGIVAAAALMRVSDSDLVDQPVDRFGWWAPLLGLLVINLGFHLKMGSPWRSMLWIQMVQLVAYAVQLVSSASFSPEISGFFGALVMTPVALLLARREGGLPSMMLLIPGFWVLMPGATGLIGLAEFVNPSTDIAGDALLTTFTTVISVGLGVLCGSTLVRAGSRLVDDDVPPPPT